MFGNRNLARCRVCQEGVAHLHCQVSPIGGFQRDGVLQFDISEEVKDLDIAWRRGQGGIGSDNFSHVLGTVEVHIIGEGDCLETHVSIYPTTIRQGHEISKTKYLDLGRVKIT